MTQANCPGRWVIYEVLKSIFEAVIYLTALSLNKHRIRLIIVTVETQHRTTSPSLPAPLLRSSAPGADPTSAHICTLAAAAAARQNLQVPSHWLGSDSCQTLPSFHAMRLQQGGGTLGLDSLSLSSEFSWVVRTWPGTGSSTRTNKLFVADLERNSGCHLG